MDLDCESANVALKVSHLYLTKKDFKKQCKLSETGTWLSESSSFKTIL